MPAYAKSLLKVAFSVAILYVIVAKSNLPEILAYFPSQPSASR